MKVMLVHAYCLALDRAELKIMKPYPPLGLLYLSAELRFQGHDVLVYDGTFRDPSEFLPECRRFEPRVVGFYVNMMTRQHVVRMARSIQELPLNTVVGGPDVAYYREEYLKLGFDAVIQGEAELSMARLLRNWEQPDTWNLIPGLSYRDGDQTVSVPVSSVKTPIDQFRFPDRKAIDIDLYLDCWERYHQVRPINLITARGCPFRCTWCSHSVYGHTFRKRSIQNVALEIEWLNKHYRFDRYWFSDDVFTIKKDWVIKWGEFLEEHDALKKPFECITRADRLDSELVDVMAKMGADLVWIGAESGSQRLLDLMKRGVTRDQVIDALNLLRGAGIKSGMFFMWGFMDEGLDDIDQTVDLAVSCQPDVALTTVAYPIKGTPYFEELDRMDALEMTIPFEEGSDRDVHINTQWNRQLYRHADVMLQSSLAERRAGQSLRQWPRRWVHAWKRKHARRQLQKKLERMTRTNS